jgi:penicillin amidase
VKRRGLAGMFFAIVGLFVLVFVQVEGVAAVPPLGATLDPATGALNVGARAALPVSSSIHIAGLPAAVTIAYSAQGIPDIQAKSQRALWFAMGYLEARNRLFEMDLIRREASGQLSAVLGPSYLTSDVFELRLGLLRTARANYAALPSTDRTILQVFSDGVNAARAYDISRHQLPVEFRLLDYTPAPWTPVDSMLIQGYLTQTLDYSQNPVDYSILVGHLGFQRTMDLFPVIAKNPQSPYDLGPYRATHHIPVDPPTTVSPALLASLESIVQASTKLPVGEIHSFSNSNNWAVAGSRSSTHNAIVAGDPHLNQTLPAVWYWVNAHAPGVSFAGVTVPGLPIILIGRNRSIAWSETDVQNQSTFFYQETTSKSHPGDYLLHGEWVPFGHLAYTVKVKGEPSRQLVVDTTVNGPIISIHGVNVAVDWLGAQVSKDFASLMGILHASNWSQFKAALAEWRAPSQNFVFGDRHGNIGMISAGYYPILSARDPWLVMNGDDGDRIVGSIPYDAIPQSYDPKSGFVFSANQRPVTANYPYYIGTSFNFFANGYRADEIHAVLSKKGKITPGDVAHLQNSVTDYLATQLVPWLVRQFRDVHEPPSVALAVQTLSRWNGSMGASSTAATIWWTFLGDEIHDTFGPWFSRYRVPEPAGSSLVVNQLNAPLVEDLQYMDLSQPSSPFFTPPGDRHSVTASTVAREALGQAVTTLTRKFGINQSNWHWDRLHFREFPSLSGVAGLSYGPRGSSGDAWTVDAADGDLLSEAGPSWRMIVAFADRGYAIYPGGQSENPLSPWYENQIADWFDGRYLPFGLGSQPSIATWILEPSS